MPNDPEPLEHPASGTEVEPRRAGMAMANPLPIAAAVDGPAPLPTFRDRSKGMESPKNRPAGLMTPAAWQHAAGSAL
jgi:hypothetical protein